MKASSPAISLQIRARRDALTNRSTRLATAGSPDVTLRVRWECVANRSFRVDGTYEDRKSGENQFIAWLKIKNAGGMRPIFRQSRKGSPQKPHAADLAALVLVSRHVSGSGYNPWQDVLARRQGRIFYWGDAKHHPTRERDDFDGNRFLGAIWLAVKEQRWPDVPPILHFSKETKGTVRFNGLCVLQDLQDAWFEDHGRRVRNYYAVLDILPVEFVAVDWIHSRRQGIEVATPKPWQIYARAGEHDRLLVRAKLVQRVKDQLPPSNSPEFQVLKQIHALPPLKAEHLVVRAFKEMRIAHTIEGTRPTRDGGFDFWGHFELPPPLEYSIALKGEVKRFEPDGANVGPRHVARLVARLQRGEHGVFVTTSAFTTQCQEEVFEDGYPVDLIAGGRLVGILQQLDAVRGGRLAEEWLV
jgi:hypothetical protein